MKIRAIDDAPFGVCITDFDCADIDAKLIDSIRLLLQQQQLVYFPNQGHLTPRDEVAFYRAIDITGTGIWRDQSNNPWEVFKVNRGNQAGSYQIPREPGVLVLGKGEINHYGLTVTLGGKRGAYGKDRGSQVLGGGSLQWHIDGCFYQHAPCNFTQMRCIEAPTSGGQWIAYNDNSGDQLWCAAGSTAFASGRIAWDALCADDKSLCLQTQVHYYPNPFQVTYQFGNSSNGLRVLDPVAEDTYLRGEEVAGDVSADPMVQVYPLVWTCASTGKQALMPQPRCLQALQLQQQNNPCLQGLVESRYRVEGWMRPAIVPQSVYVHDWQAGDLVIWNNRCLWHSATGKLAEHDRRVMHLTAFNSNQAPRCRVPT